MPEQEAARAEALFPPVYLVDDEAAVRDAVSFLLASHGLDVRVFDGAPALLREFNRVEPQQGCIVLDVRMEPMSGLQLFDELQLRGTRLPVIFLSGHGDIAMAVEALKQGAFDFAEKPFHDDDLLERVRKALRFSVAQQSDASLRRTVRAKLDRLTERERQIMLLVAAGKLNKVIADELHISVRTVEVHRSRVFAKLGVRSAAELATLLVRGRG